MCKSEIMPPVFFFRRQDATHFAWIKKAQRNKINISIPLSYQISSVFISVSRSYTLALPCFQIIGTSPKYNSNSTQSFCVLKNHQQVTLKI